MQLQKRSPWLLLTMFISLSVVCVQAAYSPVKGGWLSKSQAERDKLTQGYRRKSYRPPVKFKPTSPAGGMGTNRRTLPTAPRLNTPQTPRTPAYNPANAMQQNLNAYNQGRLVQPSTPTGRSPGVNPSSQAVRPVLPQPTRPQPIQPNRPSVPTPVQAAQWDAVQADRMTSQTKDSLPLAPKTAPRWDDVNPVDSEQSKPIETPEQQPQWDDTPVSETDVSVEKHRKPLKLIVDGIEIDPAIFERTLTTPIPAEQPQWEETPPAEPDVRKKMPSRKLIELSSGGWDGPSASPVAPEPAWDETTDEGISDNPLANIGWGIVSAVDTEVELAEVYAELGLDPAATGSAFSFAEKLDHALVTGLDDQDQAYENKVSGAESTAEVLAGASWDVDSSDIPIPSTQPNWEQNGAISRPEVADYEIDPEMTLKDLHTEADGSVVHVVDSLANNQNQGWDKQVRIMGWNDWRDSETANRIKLLNHYYRVNGIPSEDTIMFGEGDRPPDLQDDMVWSERYSTFISRSAFLNEHKLDAQHEQRMLDARQEAEASWDEYYRENGPMPLDQRIHNAAQALNAVHMKWKMLDGLNASTLGYSVVDLDRLTNHMDRAIAEGASPEDIRELAKGFSRMHMAEDQAEAANQECNALYAEYCEDRAKDSLTVAAGTLGLAGMALEVGGYGVAAYVSGDDVSDTMTEKTLEVLPTKTAQCMYDYLYRDKPPVSGYDVLGAALSDGMTAFGLVGDLRSGHIFGEAIEAGGHMVDDIADAARKLPAVELDFAQGRVAGKKKVAGFMDKYDDAVRDAATKGKKFNLEDYPDVKGAWWDVQRDGHAKQLINSDPKQVSKMFGKDKGDLVDAFNDAKTQTYKASDDKLKEQLAEEYRKMGYSVKADDIDLPGATNPSKAKKISIDRDLTGKVNVVDKSGNVKAIEVPEDIMNKALGESLYEAAGRPSMDKVDPDGIGKIPWPDATDADRFRRLGDQVGVERLGAEAYGHDVFQLQSALDYKSEIFASNMEFGRTFGHKGHEWTANSEKLLEAAKNTPNPVQAAKLRAHAQAYAEEGARQITKQWKNQVIPGLKEVAEMGYKLDVPIPKSPPRKLWDAMECMDKIGKVGPDGRLVTPELVNQQLKLMGYPDGMKDVTTKASDFLVNYEKAVMGNKPLKDGLMDKGLTDRVNDMWNGKNGVRMHNSSDVDLRGNKPKDTK